MADAWSKVEDDALRKYHAQGFSMAQIAGLLADAGLPVRTRNSIIGRCGRLGLASRRTAAPRKVSLRTITRVEPASVVHFVRPKPAPPAPRGEPVRFLDRAFGQCAMILDDRVTIFDRMVCGSPVLAGRSWCAACAGVVFGKGTESEGSAVRDVVVLARRFG
jgi:hypothetical protein